MNEPASSASPAPTSRRKTAEVHSLLETLILKRESEIAEIEQMVDRYERRLRMEQQAYRTMSPIRRMLAGKKPDHHLALEYIHYVKKPMERVHSLREEIGKYRAMLDGTVPAELPSSLLD
ncbi:hypothetical protein ACFPVX_07940 [Cohnella faecalis]|uniref:Uncharacterized protein n=1 Tax=Cohnella faecalis TaxID=2315694 RepID=A0A398CTN1_9BACL|nr:hypothetical protein [Cohnella faecalis]RIE04068.1 hypothetical protein D3H35_08975 [Cohnella faecalis]